MENKQSLYETDDAVRQYMDAAERVINLTREWLNSRRYPCVVDSGPEGVVERTPTAQQIEQWVDAVTEARDELRFPDFKARVIDRLRRGETIDPRDINHLEDTWK